MLKFQKQSPNGSPRLIHLGQFSNLLHRPKNEHHSQAKIASDTILADICTA